MALPAVSASRSHAESVDRGFPDHIARHINEEPKDPPDVVRYLSGMPPQGEQFHFLIGEWDVTATRHAPDGSPVLQYKATWSASYLNGRRMILDDFRACAPTGEPVSSFVTLRTYSEATRRWEMAGLPALQPATIASWHGEFKDGEMLLDATGRDPAGTPVRTTIRFFDIAQGSFRWESRVSLDDGRTWVLGASLLATRVS